MKDSNNISILFSTHFGLEIQWVDLLNMDGYDNLGFAFVYNPQYNVYGGVLFREVNDYYSEYIILIPRDSIIAAKVNEKNLEELDIDKDFVAYGISMGAMYDRFLINCTIEMTRYISGNAYDCNRNIACQPQFASSYPLKVCSAKRLKEIKDLNTTKLSREYSTKQRDRHQHDIDEDNNIIDRINYHISMDLE